MEDILVFILFILSPKVETTSIDKNSLSLGSDGKSCSVKEVNKFQEIVKGQKNEVYFSYRYISE